MFEHRSRTTVRCVLVWPSWADEVTYRHEMAIHELDTFFIGFGPALWAELGRVFPEDGLVVVNYSRINTHDRAWGKVLPLDDRAALGNNSFQWKRDAGMAPHRFLHNCLPEREYISAGNI